MSFILGINPSYFCNFRCDFCYLGEKKLSDKHKISPKLLEEKLSELQEYGDISYVNLFGGEITLLPDSYFWEIINVIENFYSGNIKIVTNLSNIKPYLLMNKFDIAVSYDFNARPFQDKVRNNIKQLNRDIELSITGSKKVLSLDPEMCINEINSFKNVKLVEIQDFNMHEFNSEFIPLTEFEDWILKWINSSNPKNFILGFEEILKESLTYGFIEHNDTQLYITPNGKFATTNFNKQKYYLDISKLSFFKEFDKIEDFIKWDYNHKNNISENSVCPTCEFFMNGCLSGGYYNTFQTDYGDCCGHRKSLKWYKYQRIKSIRNSS